MNIALDNIIYSLQKAGGISYYWNELSGRIRKVERNTISISQRNRISIFDNAKSVRSENERIENLPISILRYLPVTTMLPPNSIFHSSYYRFSLQPSVTNITTVHDFTYELFRKPPARTIHSIQKRLALHKSDGIICVSENTKQDLIRYYPKLKKKPITVIYNGIGHCFKSMKKRKVPSNNILYIGERGSYKNFSMAVDAVAKSNKYQLTVIGGGELSKSEKLNLDLKLRTRYTHLLGISSESINEYLNEAFCLMYPSSYEGFGIPIVEAMRAGCPVIASRNSAIPEVVGSAYVLAEEPTAELLFQHLVKLENQTFRMQQIESGLHHSDKFSWDRCYNETLSFYKEVFKSRKFP